MKKLQIIQLFVSNIHNDILGMYCDLVNVSKAFFGMVLKHLFENVDRIQWTDFVIENDKTKEQAHLYGINIDCEKEPLGFNSRFP